MRRVSARLWTLGLLAVALLGAAAIALVHRERVRDLGPRADRPPLMLLTSLPLIFPEEFSLSGGGSNALRALETRYRVIPIGTTDAMSLREARLLLMAHPLAQPAENLVALDDWVRNGGRVLLLADPRLEWPSARPLGDKLRPPPGFADTGLLQHWGVTLEAPERSATAERALGGLSVLAASPGTLSGSCDIAGDRFVARCRVGRGRATIVADADFLNAEAAGEAGDANLDALLAELAAIER